MSGAGHDVMSVAEVTEQAKAALVGSLDAAFVMQVPSGAIIASTPAASRLLDPAGDDIVGRRLEELTGDEPGGALALFADGLINGYEASRTLSRPDGPDLRVGLWCRRFDHQATSRFALVLITTDAPSLEAPGTRFAPEGEPVIGTVSRSGAIEQCTHGTVALFGKPPAQLLGVPVSDLVEVADAEKWHAATSAASSGEHAVTVVVRTRMTGKPPGLAPTVCDVLLLPLRPGFTFIFLPVTGGAPRALDTVGVQSMLMSLSRVAGLAQSERQRTSGFDEQDLPGLSDLTSGERDMLTRLISGYRVGSIADDLVLSPSTVRTHLASIFAKLGVSNQSDLLDAVRSSRPHLGWSERYPSWQEK
jgi:DNA-binding CsgD family transcriptional regulator/PAS domain-containing protein